MAPKKIVIRKPATIKKPGDTYAGAPDIPQLRTRAIRAPKPKIVEGPSGDKPRAPAPQEAGRFKFYCVRCGQKLAAQADWAGRDVNCTTCNSVITIPSPPED